MLSLRFCGLSVMRTALSPGVCQDMGCFKTWELAMKGRSHLALTQKLLHRAQVLTRRSVALRQALH